MYDHYQTRIAGTTIDGATLLSTDYFNVFNEITMLLGILPEMPEMIDEIETWRFRSYAEHFRDSGLPFAPLAIDAYQHVPPPIRARFEQTVEEMRVTVAEAKETLGRLARDADRDRFAVGALDYAARLQGLVDTGSAIVHGADESSDQAAVDALF